ncbi:Uncharacterized protein SCF082_LOCUS42362 [Durusdinium trenchii]|uniref:Uncharacterized protein n=1 Tax=Durusdinium trenchii TaxID=1381693 RepID=A0ABP0QNF0_9DINO
MDGPSMMTATLAVLWAPLHLGLTSMDWSDLYSYWASWAEAEHGGAPSSKEARVAEEMLKVRQSNYKLFSRCLTHLDFITGLFFFYSASATPNGASISWLTCCGVAYVQHLAVGNESLELTPQRLKFFSYLLHLLTLLVILGSGLSGIFQFALMQGFQTAIRFCLVLCFLDPSVSIPFQFLFTLVEILIHFYYFSQSQESGAQLCSVCWCQFFILVECVAASVFTDLLLRQRLHAQLDTLDAETLLGSFRRVLRGVCDGDVLLDHQMKIAQDSECLKHLILTDVSLKDRSFEELLASEEQARFQSFIEKSTASAVDRDEDSGPPLCLRLSLRGAAGIRVGADVYHVPVPKLFGAGQPYHLIAFKEDPEARPQPDASEDAVPKELLHSWETQGNGWTSRSAASMVSSGGRSSCHVCPELEQITLLIDVGTECQDVPQAHLSFERREAEGESHMPSLRKLVKPTDWPKLSASVRRFVQRALERPNVPPKTLKKLALQLPSQKGWVLAEEATMHQIQNSQRVWLHLKGFRPEKSVRVSSLNLIEETVTRPMRSRCARGSRDGDDGADEAERCRFPAEKVFEGGG